MLRGECLLIVEGEEVPLGEWDFFHCPPDVPTSSSVPATTSALVLAVGSRLGPKEAASTPSTRPQSHTAPGSRWRQAIPGRRTPASRDDVEVEFREEFLHGTRRSMPTPASIQRTYLILLLGNTLAASLIWGINTIFLLDAGLSNLEAFTANAFFTAGMVIFEVPTGIVADTVGRRASYLLGTVTLAATTLLYVLLWQVEAPFWAWAVVSILLGLGFTFFSGAVEAWLVDALTATGFEGSLESVFGKGQVVMRRRDAGRVGGRRLHRPAHEPRRALRPARRRARVMFGVAFVLMRDIGFTPRAGRRADAGDAPDLGRLDRVRLAGAGGEMDHARLAVRRRRRPLRLLRPAAVPARAVRRPGGVRHRGPRRRDRGGRADRRRPRRAAHPEAVPPAHVGADRRDRGERR